MDGDGGRHDGTWRRNTPNNSLGKDKTQNFTHSGSTSNVTEMQIYVCKQQDYVRTLYRPVGIGHTQTNILRVYWSRSRLYLPMVPKDRAFHLLLFAIDAFLDNC